MLRSGILIMFVVLATGILAADVTGASAALCGVALAAALALLGVSMRRGRYVLVCALVVCAAVGALAAASQRLPAAPPVCNDSTHLWRVRIAGPIERSLDADGHLVRRVLVQLVAQRCGAQWVHRHGRVRLGLWQGPPVFRGDLIEVALGLSPVQPALNPVGRDPRTVARAQQLVARARVLGPHAVVHRAGDLLAHVDRWRALAARGIEAVLPYQQAAITKALALGDRGAISPDQRDVWADAGIAHLLAISGLHVGIVAAGVYALAFFLLGWLPWAAEWFSSRRLAAAIAMIAVIVFCIWSGASASTVRATVMAGAILGGLVVGRPASAQNSLGLAGVGILLWDPTSLYDAGFLLSFAAVTALLLAPQLPRASGRWRRARRWLVAALLTSVVATLATAPVSAYEFGRVSCIGPLTNLVAVPLGALVATPLALLLAISIPVLPGLAHPVAALLHPVLTALQTVAQHAAAAPLAAVDVPQPHSWEILAYASLLLGVVLLRRRRWARWLVVAGGVLAIVSVSVRVAAARGDGRLTVIIPYVGEGDGAVVRLPHGGTIVVDAGGSFMPDGWDPGRNVMAPLLRRLGVHHIDLAVVTHPHPDHIGGFAYLARHFAIDALWCDGYDTPAQRHLVARVRAEGGVVRTPSQLPVHLQREGVAIDILHPRPGAAAEGLPYYPGLDLNDNSVVLRLRYGRRSILLPGDIERASEQMLAGELGPTDIIKVPHHGSDTSSTPLLLDRIRPRVAVISCGQHNHFGFPKADVVARYRSGGTTVLRTDIDGMITMQTAGKVWRVRTQRGLQLRVGRRRRPQTHRRQSLSR